MVWAITFGAVVKLNKKLESFADLELKVSRLEASLAGLLDRYGAAPRSSCRVKARP